MCSIGDNLVRGITVEALSIELLEQPGLSDLPFVVLVNSGVQYSEGHQ